MRHIDSFRSNMVDPLENNPGSDYNRPNYSSSAPRRESNNEGAISLANPNFERWGLRNPSEEEICLSPSFLEMIRLRVAILENCQTCVEQHSDRLNFFGEDACRIDQLKCWEHSKLFDDSERAALALTDMLCASGPVPISKTVSKARQHFNEAELLKIVLIVLASHEESH